MIDRQLQDAIPGLNEAVPPGIGFDEIGMLRTRLPHSTATEIIDGRPITHVDYAVVAGQGHEIPVTVFSPSAGSLHRPGIFHIHGGGTIAGHRLDGMHTILDWVLDNDAVAATVEYRLAPENPFPNPSDDCYEALQWFFKNFAMLGFDPTRTIIAGGSAGGGLAAGLALRLRDEESHLLAGQVLMYPMLDDRDRTVSARQSETAPVWARASVRTSWAAYLGDAAGGTNVSEYAAPSRANKLSGLPPAYIDCGDIDGFRDEAVDYASRIWEDGGSADLHIWSGAFHAFDALVPSADISKIAIHTRREWVSRTLRAIGQDQMPLKAIAAGSKTWPPL